MEFITFRAVIEIKEDIPVMDSEIYICGFVKEQL